MNQPAALQKLLIATAVASAFTLSGCGGGGGGGYDSTNNNGGNNNNTALASETVVSGVVADDPIKNAVVCLDLNGNKACDAGEPQATTDANGKYTFKATVEQLAKSAILAVMTPESREMFKAADGSISELSVAIDLKLSAPPGKPDFVSPLTTLVHGQMEKDGVDSDTAQKTVKDQLGLPDVDLLADYVKQGRDAKPDAGDVDAVALKKQYQKAHNIAQVVAKTVGDNVKLIKDTLGDDSQFKAKLNQIVQLVTEKVLAELKAQGISQHVSGDKPQDKTEIGTVIKDHVKPPEQIVGGDKTAIDNVIKEAEKPRPSQPTAAQIKAALTAGLYGLELRHNLQGCSQEAERSFHQLNNDGSILEKHEHYVGGQWQALPPDDHDDFLALTLQGWLQFSQLKQMLTFTDGGQAVLDNGAVKELLHVTSLPIAGSKLIEALARTLPGDDMLLPMLASHLTEPNTMMPVGAEAYRVGLVSLQDAYYGQPDRNGQGNPNLSVPKVVADLTLDDVLNRYAYDSQLRQPWMGLFLAPLPAQDGQGQNLHLQFDKAKNKAYFIKYAYWMNAGQKCAMPVSTLLAEADYILADGKISLNVPDAVKAALANMQGFAGASKLVIDLLKQENRADVRVLVTLANQIDVPMLRQFNARSPLTTFDAFLGRFAYSADSAFNDMDKTLWVTEGKGNGLLAAQLQREGNASEGDVFFSRRIPGDGGMFKMLPETEKGHWDIRTVNGVQVLVVKVPQEIKQRYRPQAQRQELLEPKNDPMFALYQGKLMAGIVRYKGAFDGGTDLELNKIAFDTIFAHYKAEGGVAAPKLALH